MKTGQGLGARKITLNHRIAKYFSNLDSKDEICVASLMTYGGPSDNNVKYSYGKFSNLSYLERHKSCNMISSTKFKILLNRGNCHSNLESRKRSHE